MSHDDSGAQAEDQAVQPEDGEEASGAPGSDELSAGPEFDHGDPTVIYVPGMEGSHPAFTPANAENVPGVEGFALVVERGPRAGMTFVLSSDTTTVGRHPDSDIFLDDITVSRHHCRFVVSAEGLAVEDSGSTNGTYVNGSRVDRADLRAGDEVIVGKYHLLVAAGDA